MTRGSPKTTETEKQRLGDRTRRRILDHAARILRQKGYASTSLRDIATAADMKIGSLYYHFASKDDLVQEVLSEGIRQVETQVREAIARAQGTGADPLEIVRLAMIAHMQAVHDRGDYASANIKCLSHTPPEMARALRLVRKALDDVWRDTLNAAIDAGQIRVDADAVTLRMGMIGMMNWTLEWRRPSDPSPAELGQQYFNILFLRGDA